ncbi:hypothetical protein BDQ94DRAFT_155029 [Aspergillus welwitschiae]|uniref:Uncharacterized protein n=1 Tax=Aspergillus welwitschiae TaxID=1341132 RepID=A0A3F3PJ16_9EURO|nr:hypothetical protein BDQ94DRAFT_155029 [Aspergillus welwitschiae]RDH26732.1 hypothetical protein BDQ94DRAFT_155029 [Aspergillus welwitschiae]
MQPIIPPYPMKPGQKYLPFSHHIKRSDICLAAPILPAMFHTWYRLCRSQAVAPVHF